MDGHALGHHHAQPSQANQQQAIQGLAERCMERLKYAHFKVENGWTKRSLPEVETLLRRQSRAPHEAKQQSFCLTSTLPASKTAKAELHARSKKGVLRSKAVPDQARARSLLAAASATEEGDVFGKYGWALPYFAEHGPGGPRRASRRQQQDRAGDAAPQNAANDTSTSSSKHTSAQAHSPSASRATNYSSPNTSYTSNHSRASASGASASKAAVAAATPAKRKRKSSVSASPAVRAAAATATTTPGGTVGTYADFWAKHGSSPARAAGATPLKRARSFAPLQDGAAAEAQPNPYFAPHAAAAGKAHSQDKSPEAHSRSPQSEKRGAPAPPSYTPLPEPLAVKPQASGLPPPPHAHVAFMQSGGQPLPPRQQQPRPAYMQQAAGAFAHAHAHAHAHAQQQGAAAGSAAPASVGSS